MANSTTNMQFQQNVLLSIGQRNRIVSCGCGVTFQAGHAKWLKGRKAGRPEWIARSEAEHIDKVVALARDVEQRKALRSSQRKRVAYRPLFDARGLAMSLENAYFEMFERWLDEKFDEKN